MHLDIQSISENHLFMYCNNNPAMYSDESKIFPFLALTAIIGAVIGGVAAGFAFGISAGVTYVAGALGYASEEWINGRVPDFGKAMLNGALVTFEGSINFLFSGIIGSVRTIGTKGKFLKSREWYAKLAFGQEFTSPLKYGIDLIRKKF